MIDHIEQYLKQHHCRDYFNSYGESVEDDHYYMYREEVDGLIELVVRECISSIHRTATLNACEFEGGMIADAVREHFGVE